MGTLILDESGVTGNHAQFGGGIYTMNSGDRGRLTLRNRSRVVNNSATWAGGIYNAASSVHVEDTSSITNNQAIGSGASGGGIFSVGDTGSPALVILLGDSRVTDNTGGGIFHTGRGGVSYRDSACIGSNEPYDCEGVSYCQLCEL
jgi:hypothetical protein